MKMWQSLLAKVRKTIQTNDLFSCGDTVIIGVSGGADSIALLDIISCLTEYNLNPVVAHINHTLRGDESDADQNFCCEAASRYGFPLETINVDVKAFAAEQRLNLEDAGRRVRMSFFANTAEKYGASAVATAHHADDQAETVLMRLLRGSGTSGLVGMAYRNEAGYVRPLLDVSRSEIESYLVEKSLLWRNDLSNLDTAFVRNRIRHELLPLLETYNSNIRSQLAVTASLLGSDEQLLSELALGELQRCFKANSDGIETSAIALCNMSTALSGRVLRQALKSVSGSLNGVNADHIKAVLDLAASDKPHLSLNLPGNIHVSREYDYVYIRPVKPCETEHREIVINQHGTFVLPWGGVINVEPSAVAEYGQDINTLFVSLADAPLPWSVRTYLPGDRIIPMGMSGRKKVKDVYIDRKIPLSERKKIPLLISGENIFWIAGICRSKCDCGDTIVKVVYTP